MQCAIEEPPVAEQEVGGLDILNVGIGHIKISFDTKDSAEAQKAKRAIEDMMKRGYALFIELKDGTLKAVKSFDAKKGCYVIEEPRTESPRRLCVRGEKKCVICKKPIKQADFYLDGGPANYSHEKCGQPPPKLGRKGYHKREVPMHKAKATAVGRSAGG